MIDQKRYEVNGDRSRGKSVQHKRRVQQPERIAPEKLSPAHLVASHTVLVDIRMAPQHESALPTLLSVRTRLPVVQVSEGTHVEPDHVYVIPPNAQMEIRDGELHLNPRPEDRTQYTPIDFFFRSLAETAGAAAIGVVLSGSSSDGAAGLREIKAVGGITIAQQPDTARYDGMPRAAIATQMVDLVLSPPDIAREILRIGRHPYVKLARPRHDGDEVAIEDRELNRLADLLGR